MSFLRTLQVVKALLRLFVQVGGVHRPGDIVEDVDSKEFEV